MNKRQVKKRNKIILRRVQFFNKHFIISGRKNGKCLLYENIYKACYSKHYKPFKLLKKYFDSLFFSVDLSNGKDYSVEITYRKNKGVFNVIQTRML